MPIWREARSNCRCISAPQLELVLCLLLCAGSNVRRSLPRNCPLPASHTLSMYVNVLLQEQNWLPVIICATHMHCTQAQRDIAEVRGRTRRYFQHWRRHLKSYIATIGKLQRELQRTRRPRRVRLASTHGRNGMGTLRLRKQCPVFCHCARRGFRHRAGNLGRGQGIRSPSVSP